MIKLEIIEKDNYLYKLKDSHDNIYIFNLEFLDITEKLSVGHYIEISEELLNPKYEGYSTAYTFGKLENEYGKANINLSDLDIIRVIIEDKEIYLKRLYG